MKSITQFSVKNGLATDPENGRFYTFITEFANEYVVNVECFRIIHFEQTSYAYYPKVVEEKGPFYERRGATNSMDTTANLDEAQRVFKGTVKWDGCSDINFYPDKEGYSHFCGRKSATDLGLLLDNAYSLAKELMADRVDEGCFEDL